MFQWKTLKYTNPKNVFSHFIIKFISQPTIIIWQLNFRGFPVSQKINHVRQF